MPLHRIPYTAAMPLVRDYLYRRGEDENTKTLFQKLRVAQERGYLRPSELQSICHWKSPRAIWHIKTNSASSIRAASTIALGTRSEKQKLEALRRLRGVSVPMASAVLMLLNPKRYGVIDIRVWEVLYKLGTVTTNPKGVAFSFNNWYQYLILIRYFAKSLRCTPRDVDRALFDAHKEFQRGRLYANR